jgi:urocanate reductase
MKFTAIVGTTSPTSHNRTLLQFMQAHFKDKAEIELLEINDVPMFNQDQPSNNAQLLEINTKIIASDGVIIATPEYNHSTPFPPA